MPLRNRHRRGPPSAAAQGSQAGGVAGDITGKRATQAKNERYFRPLPVLVANAKDKQQAAPSWSQWLASWLPSSSSTETGPGEDMLIGYWDTVTASVWVQVTPSGATKAGKLDTTSRIASQTKTCRALWDCGFFGKGSLSRSEPTWRTRKINEERVKKQREHGMKGEVHRSNTLGRQPWLASDLLNVGAIASSPSQPTLPRS